MDEYYERQLMTTNAMYVRNSLIAMIGVVLFVATITGGILFYHQQEVNEMTSCVKSGKEWTVVKPDEHSSNIEKVCVTKK